MNTSEQGQVPVEPLRLGISMRVQLDERTGERRDALAQDWATFLQHALPDCLWMPIPNRLPDVLLQLNGWKLNGLILSGGNDIGTTPDRDETEQMLLRWSCCHRIPTVAICRGLQLLCTYHGGTLRRVDSSMHVAQHHRIKRWWPQGLRTEPSGGAEDGLQPAFRPSASPVDTVNSFHSWGIEHVPPHLQPIAITDSDEVEGLCHHSLPQVGIMWHPERYPTPDPYDVALFRSLFSRNPSPWR